MKDDTDEVLIFQDETELHRLPTLNRLWQLKGRQAEVSSPGQNSKVVVYGEVDYATGRIIHTVAPTKSGWNFITFLKALLKVYADRKIRLVCDNARFHHTKAVEAFLADHCEHLKVFWLPPYCPNLNLIERLWGHLKRTVLANVLFRTMDDLVAAFRRGVGCINRHRNHMRFMFDHDNVKTKIA